MAMPNQVARGVFVFTSECMATTSTVFVRGGSAILIDPAWQESELAAIADFLALLGARVALGWATHAHHDHVLWHEQFGSAPRLASVAAAQAAREHHDEILAALSPALRPLAGKVSAYAGNHLPIPGADIEIVTHHGHSRGHSALWCPRSGVLVAGDMLSDREIPLAGETGIDAYRAGLEKLAPYVARARVLIPGHGAVAVAGTEDSPLARLRADRRYLRMLASGEASGGGPVEHRLADSRLADPGLADSRLTHAPAWMLEEHEANLRAAGD